MSVLAGQPAAVEYRAVNRRLGHRRRDPAGELGFRARTGDPEQRAEGRGLNDAISPPRICSPNVTRLVEYIGRGV